MSGKFDMMSLIKKAKEKDAQLTSSKTNKNKKSKKRKISEADEAEPDANAEKQNDKTEYEYEVDDDDHCETPEAAYENIQKVLELIAHKLGKTPAELSIYDPYYCQGSMVKRMQHCGFNNVYNRKEDFYEKLRTKTIPEYDVLLTNPPYSGSHMRKLVQFVNSSNKPYCLLIPNYVYMKDYYQAILSPTEVVWEPGAVTPTVTKSSKPPADNFYIVPNKRYLYTTPNGRRQGKSAKYTSPFPTFWFCNIGASLGPTKAFLSELKNRLTNTNSNRTVPGAPNTATTSASSYSSGPSSSADQTAGGGPSAGPTAFTNTYKIANSIATLPMEIRCDEDPLKKAQKVAQHGKKNKMSQKERNSHKATKRPKSNVR